jgi:hypothetical protein
VPVLECREEFFVNWDSTKADFYMTQDDLRIDKLPYPQFLLVQNVNDPAP